MPTMTNALSPASSQSALRAPEAYLPAELASESDQEEMATPQASGRPSTEREAELRLRVKLEAEVPAKRELRYISVLPAV